MVNPSETSSRGRHPVVFAVYREAAGPVFSSQAVGPVAWLEARGQPIRLLSFVPIGAWLRSAARRSFRSLQRAVASRLREPAAWLPAPPSRMQADWVGALSLAAWLRWQYGRQPVILHCRGATMTALGLRVRQRRRNLQVIFDCRGVSHAELAYEQAQAGHPSAAWEDARRRLYALEQGCVRDADAVLAVSHAMARYLTTEFGADPNRLRVVPCVVDAAGFTNAAAARAAVRDELGFADRLVVTYCGGLHPWQLPEQSFRVFRRIQQIVPNAHFFALTTQPERMQALALRSGLSLDDLTVRRVPHAQVGRYLSAGDIGLLLREPSLVNVVASPVKFGEYLAAGLPVVLTEGIGDYADLTRRKGLGLVIDLDDDEPALKAALDQFLRTEMAAPDTLRARCQDAAQRLLSPAACYSVLEALYGRLSQGQGDDRARLGS